MERFIQYLYEYENGERARNLGFMKVEPKMDKVEINIFSKQLDEVFGIWFRKPDGSCYIAAWENPEVEEVPSLARPEVEEASSLVGPEVEEKGDFDPADMKKMCARGQECEEAGSKPLKIVDLTPVREIVAPAQENTAQEIEDPYIPPSSRTYEKIQRQDLSRLPRKEWKLANNNFLLHGFYNYHHLLWIEDEGKVFIGVPGVFHERERMAAESFGFPEFMRLTDFEVELSEEEKNTMDDFGYWCRQVEHF